MMPGTSLMIRVAVSPKNQGKGIGKEMAQAAEKWAAQNGFRKIVLHARKVSLNFYQNLHYTLVGKPFIEVGIEHFKMEKEIG